MTFQKDTSPRWSRDKEIRPKAVEVPPGDTEALVRRTISECSANGIPEQSKKRIKRGLEKLRVDKIATPGGKIAVRTRRRGLLLGLVGLAVLAVFVPLWVFPFVLIVGLIGVMLTVAICGTERIAGWVVQWYRRLKERDADAAERLRRRAARVSAIVTAIAARLPERWVRGLYLPDFEPDAEQPEKMRSDPFERLSV